MSSTTVIKSRYEDTFNTEPTHGISCCCIYYMWPLATDSRLLQTCTVRLPLHSDGMEQNAPALEDNLKEVKLSKVTLSKQ
jgi:hypothetical protein